MFNKYSEQTIQQAERWYSKFKEARIAGPWRDFDDQFKAFVGFACVIANDPVANSSLIHFIGEMDSNQVVLSVKNAIDECVEGIISQPEPHASLFKPRVKELEEQISKLIAYIKAAPEYLDTIYNESPEIIDRSLKLRDIFESLSNNSVDFRRPCIEATFIYIYGTILSNTSVTDYYQILSNPNHMPFGSELMEDSIDAVLNALKLNTESEQIRIKGQKFGILDSPILLENDLIQFDNYTLGCACLYIDIDDFKPLNTRFSERVVDSNILIPFQEILHNTINGIGYAYAEGGDECIVFLPQASLKIAIALEATFRDTLESTFFEVDGEKVKINVSVGLSYAAKGENRTKIADHANLALRKAKELGKNRVIFYSHGNYSNVIFSLDFKEQ